MGVGILKIGNGECISDVTAVDTNRVSYELGKHGYFVKTLVEISDSQRISDSFAFLQNSCDSVLICGDTSAFYEVMSAKYELNRNMSTFLLGDTPCAVSDECPPEFVSNVLIPMLNGKSKTFYATSVFRTIGKTEQQLRLLLKDYIKNRSKITFKFVSRPPECTVLIRYSNKMQKLTVDELLSNVSALLKDCTYSYDESSLPEKVAELLIEQQKTVGLAESFTGGNIASALVEIPGISQSLKEGIVCYSNDCKIKRLRVSPNILEHYGAVSIETAYEMAANLLMDGNYDYVVATTGNAGPTAEKQNEVGICYIAVGDKNNIDIYPYKFSGDRTTVIDSGTKTALYHLYRFITDSLAVNKSQD